MRSFRKPIQILLSIVLGLGLSTAWAQKAPGAATLLRMSLLKGSGLEVEITASAPVTPKTQVITGPDRLVLDFPNSLPSKEIHNLDVDRGNLTAARVGLFSSNPPVTRVVMDLKSPQAYQVFSSGNTVTVKFSENAASSADSDAQQTIVSVEQAGGEPGIPANAAPPASQTPAVPAQPAPRVEVSFENGLLSIRSNNANLSEVLSEIRRRTGAEIAIPAGAESEQVFTNLGPGSPKEVLGSLLNGSHFNFIVIGSERDPGGVRQVVLTPKQPGATAEAVTYPCGSSQPAVAQAAPVPAVSPMAAPPMSPPPDAADPSDSQQGQPQTDTNQPPPQ